jgi:hypothetical protein
MRLFTIWLLLLGISVISFQVSMSFSLLFLLFDSPHSIITSFFITENRAFFFSIGVGGTFRKGQLVIQTTNMNTTKARHFPHLIFGNPDFASRQRIQPWSRRVYPGDT